MASFVRFSAAPFTGIDYIEYYSDFIITSRLSSQMTADIFYSIQTRLLLVTYTHGSEPRES